MLSCGEELENVFQFLKQDDVATDLSKGFVADFSIRWVDCHA